jgi:hypothetical protein
LIDLKVSMALFGGGFFSTPNAWWSGVEKVLKTYLVPDIPFMLISARLSHNAGYE